MQTIRDLAVARGSVDEYRRERDAKLAEVEAEYGELITTAEREDMKAYNAAVKAGWSDAELRRIGFADASKPARRRTRRSTPAASTPAEPGPSLGEGYQGDE